VCKAKPLNPSKHLVKGESHRYLMASEFGFDQSEQILINPDVNVQVYCGEREEMREENLCTNNIQHGANVLFTCSIENFGRKYFLKLFFIFDESKFKICLLKTDTSYSELKINKIEWKKLDNIEIPSETTTIGKISSTQLNMSIRNFSDINKGIYACYAHASSGTIRQLFQIQRSSKNSQYEIKFSKASKRINLDIEERIHGMSQIDKPILGESYEFDCVTGSFLIKT